MKDELMNLRSVRKVVIAGGGTAGWISATALSVQLGKLLDITLVESDQIPTVGVGEATIPTHQTFHQLLGVDECAFMRACRATFKLGIAFENWGAIGDRYLHSFGDIGQSHWMGDFQHIWHQANAEGFGGPLEEYCLELQAAEKGRFETSERGLLSYAYHLDAGLYAKFLRELSESNGVKRIEGKINNIQLDSESGEIKSISLEDGQAIEGDLFIDCTGFRALLIEKALGVPFEEWGHWLPVNRALAMQTSLQGELLPYTRSIAQPAGWRWRIPLQHRVGNGHVYSSEYMSDEEAHRLLLEGVDAGAEALTEPRLIKFRTGRRKQVWAKNCIAIGLSSGFLEPLESTSIHLIQIGITRLIQMFPFTGIRPSLINHFNQYAVVELEGIRDFLILHYALTKRDDTPFWRDCQALELPASLQHRMALYRESAIAYQDSSDLFRADSWVQVLRGQGMQCSGYHHMAQLMKPGKLEEQLSNLRTGIARAVDKMPKHEEFVKTYCNVETY